MHVKEPGCMSNALMPDTLRCICCPVELARHGGGSGGHHLPESSRLMAASTDDKFMEMAAAMQVCQR